jgi:hypothetical protein
MTLTNPHKIRNQVTRLLAQRCGNKQIAGPSASVPRTVKQHLGRWISSWGGRNGA